MAFPPVNNFCMAKLCQKAKTFSDELYTVKKVGYVVLPNGISTLQLGQIKVLNSQNV